MALKRSRPRKRHQQLDMLDKTGTSLSAKRRTWKRKRRSKGEATKRGPGRPRKTPLGSSPHKRRPTISRRSPVHVVLRIVDEMPSLRRRLMYRAIGAATLVAAVREDFRIIHLSIQRNHIHLLVEADNRTTLSRGVQAFQISAAKRLNAALRWEVRRRGQVFANRYHAKVITSPRQARHALAYVLNNWRKHREDREDGARAWKVDPFSSAWCFGGWKERERELFPMKVADGAEQLVVWSPRTWLLQEGWRRHGLIGFREVPSSQPVRH